MSAVTTSRIFDDFLSWRLNLVVIDHDQPYQALSPFHSTQPLTPPKRVTWDTFHLLSSMLRPMAHKVEELIQEYDPRLCSWEAYCESVIDDYFDEDIEKICRNVLKSHSIQ